MSRGLLYPEHVPLAPAALEGARSHARMKRLLGTHAARGPAVSASHLMPPHRDALY